MPHVFLAFQQSHEGGRTGCKGRIRALGQHAEWHQGKSGNAHVPVLGYRVLGVVGNGQDDDAVADRLIIHVVELRYVRMSQRLFCCQSLVWIEHEQLAADIASRPQKPKHFNNAMD